MSSQSVTAMPLSVEPAAEAPAVDACSTAARAGVGSVEAAGAAEPAVPPPDVESGAIASTLEADVAFAGGGGAAAPEAVDAEAPLDVGW